MKTITLLCWAKSDNFVGTHTYDSIICSMNCDLDFIRMPKKKTDIRNEHNFLPNNSKIENSGMFASHHECLNTFCERNTSKMSQQNKLFHVKNQFYSNITIMTSEKPTL